MARLEVPPTRQWRNGVAFIDVFAVSTAWTWRWRLTSSAASTSSDHTCICASDQPWGVPVSRVRTPAVLQRLPDEALVDLRRRYRLLEHLFGIKPACGLAPDPPGQAPPRVEEL
eukprot:1240766-Alexandrium_andersonii.AAC.1